MILIFSQRSDYATSQVCMWLQAMKKGFIRLNMEDDYVFTYISSEKIIVICYLAILIGIEGMESLQNILITRKQNFQRLNYHISERNTKP